MAGLKFIGGQVQKVYSSYLNNLAKSNENSVLSGCLVTESSPQAATIDVASGSIFFGVDKATVTAQPDIAIAANSSGNTRLDLVVLNSLGVASIVQGTPNAVLPIPADYDTDLFIPIAQITVADSFSSIINSNIEDIRVLNIGGGGSGGAFARFIEEFTSQTSVTVTHNLGDDEPMVFVYNSSNKLLIPQDVTITDTNELVVDFSISTTGKIIVYGGAGVNNAYFAQDFSSVSTVNVVHNLGNTNVLVQVIDSSGETVIPTSVVRTDANTVDVTFGANETGTVIIAGGISTVGLPQSPVQGEIIYYNGTDWVVLGVGTANEVLRTNGAAANPSWGNIKLISFTVAGVPSASTEGAGTLIFVTDETGGAVIAFSDGTDWRRCTDRAIVS